MGFMIGVRSARRRLSTLLVAFALAAGVLLLLQQQAHAAPQAVAGGAAQIGGLISSLLCPILLAIRNAFTGGFFDFVAEILNQFLVAFGCAPSG
jgi:hypothetical protein